MSNKAKYRAMLPAQIREDFPKVGEYFDREVDDLMRILKRRDRITWFLRIIRAFLLETVTYQIDTSSEFKRMVDKALREANLKPGELRGRNDLARIKSHLAHYMGVPAPKLQTYTFDRQHYQVLLDDLEAIEEEWIEANTDEGRISYDAYSVAPEVFIDFGNGVQWVNLGVSECSHEAEAMGHCGNRFGNRRDTILSLRTKDDARKSWAVHLTFILDEDGYLGEMKGRANEKPQPKYHPYIIKLLEDPRVTGIKGGGYAPHKNFAIMDIPKDEAARLVRMKPALATPYAYWELFKTWDDTLIKMVRDGNEKEFNGTLKLSTIGKVEMVHLMDLELRETRIDLPSDDYISYDVEISDEEITDFLRTITTLKDEERIIAYVNEKQEDGEEKIDDIKDAIRWLLDMSDDLIYLADSSMRMGIEIGTYDKMWEDIRYQLNGYVGVEGVESLSFFMKCDDLETLHLYLPPGDVAKLASPDTEEGYWLHEVSGDIASDIASNIELPKIDIYNYSWNYDFGAAFEYFYDNSPVLIEGSAHVHRVISPEFSKRIKAKIAKADTA